MLTCPCNADPPCIPFLYSKLRVYRGIHYFLSFALNIQQFFTAGKNGTFQMKKCDIFLIFAQNIDRGYALEPPQLYVRTASIIRLNRLIEAF